MFFTYVFPKLCKVGNNICHYFDRPAFYWTTTPCREILRYSTNRNRSSPKGGCEKSPGTGIHFLPYPSATEHEHALVSILWHGVPATRNSRVTVEQGYTIPSDLRFGKSWQQFKKIISPTLSDAEIRPLPLCYYYIFFFFFFFLIYIFFIYLVFLGCVLFWVF